MNFVRISNTLPQSPKVALFAREMRCSFDEALGYMLQWLCWLDKHTEDGKTKLHVHELDKLIFAGRLRTHAFIALGWATEDKDGHVCSVDFEQYNGPTAKAKALAAAKKRNQRSKK